MDRVVVDIREVEIDCLGALKAILESLDFILRKVEGFLGVLVSE